MVRGAYPTRLESVLTRLYRIIMDISEQAHKWSLVKKYFYNASVSFSEKDYVRMLQIIDYIIDNQYYVKLSPSTSHMFLVIEKKDCKSNCSACVRIEQDENNVIFEFLTSDSEGLEMTDCCSIDDVNKNLNIYLNQLLNC